MGGNADPETCANKRSGMNGRRFVVASVAVVLLHAGTGLALAQEPGSTIAADARLQDRTYTFEETGVEVPYALFVPSSYDASREASRTSTCGRSLILDLDSFSTLDAD